jgi:hypothetical protein
MEYDPNMKFSSNEISADDPTPKRIVLKRSDFNKIAELKNDLPVSYVHTPEWGIALEIDPAQCYVCIRSLTGAERDAYESSLLVGKGRNRQMNFNNARAKLVALTMIDPDTHERLFADHEVAQLGQRSAAALDRVWNASRKLSGLSEEDVEDLVGELKNE